MVLSQFADDYRCVTPESFRALAEECWDLGIARLDVRYFVLRDCFDITWSFWGREDVGSSVSRDLSARLEHHWSRRLPDILSEPEEEPAVALALALREELMLLSELVEDPLTFRDV